MFAFASIAWLTPQPEDPLAVVPLIIRTSSCKFTCTSSSACGVIPVDANLCTFWIAFLSPHPWLSTIQRAPYIMMGQTIAICIQYIKGLLISNLPYFLGITYDLISLSRVIINFSSQLSSHQNGGSFDHCTFDATVRLASLIYFFFIC